MKPKISILCPSFNHEKYVESFIWSVLGQSFKDFELIIVDDCSSDGNVKKIKEIQDKRIKLIQHQYNRGINASINTAFQNSSGKIVVFCASDDILEVNALEIIYKTFECNEDIICVYPNLQIIDEYNNILDVENITKIAPRNELLHHIFFESNCLSSPGMSIKRGIFEAIYPLKNSFCNYQDVDIHIRLLTIGKVLQLEQKLIKYRRSLYKTSISSEKSSTAIRKKLETESLMDSFLEIKDLKFLKQIFRSEIEKTGIKPFDNTLEFFMGRMALESNNELKKYWGYHKVMNFYNNDQNAQLLYDKYGFTFGDFLGLADFMTEDLMFKKYKKYKKLFNYGILFCVILLFCFVLLLMLEDF
ncbi:glycosyltransferase family 2 protein [Helicobacter pullorum]|uniref:Glycosyl transferase family 2 n=1 Tax=Helicobacter pullorum TaxID=35818 RepID=A0A0N0LU41_9HELI|nr:glycosyltransferase [Helicobacter pullorum]KPH55949.1 glycosyl transferase family 2 [Helicobacter pullorum]OCR15853.1 glycosyl transferase family 2 [Helicobacter pullorum]